METEVEMHEVLTYMREELATKSQENAVLKAIIAKLQKQLQGQTENADL